MTINKNIFQQNINIIQKKYPALAKKLHNLAVVDKNKYILTRAKNESWTLQIKHQMDSYFLHSKYNQILRYL